MDRQSVYALSVLTPDNDGTEDSRTHIESQLREFVLEFRLDNAFIYRYGSCLRTMRTMIVTHFAEIRSDKTY